MKSKQRSKARAGPSTRRRAPSRSNTNRRKPAARSRVARRAKAHRPKARKTRSESKASRATPKKAATARRAQPSANGAKPTHAPGVDGVNVNDLVVMAEKVKNNPAMAEYTFRANTHWLGGAHAKTKIQGFWAGGQEDRSRARSFTLEADEPTTLLGTDHGPSPVEYALAGLGSSFAEGLAYNAAARGIKLDAIEIELEGGLDLRGTLGVRGSAKPGESNGDLRPGFESIRMVCNLKSEAPPSELKELVEYTKQTSPLLDMFQHPVPIAVEVKH